MLADQLLRLNAGLRWWGAVVFDKHKENSATRRAIRTAESR